MYFYKGPEHIFGRHDEENQLPAGYQAIATALKDMGVDTLYGVMGDGNMQFISSFVHDCGGRYVAARHEGGAVNLADGATRVLGGQSLGVATVTHGPGLTNAMTALTAAVRNRTPLLLVAGDLPRPAVRHNQKIDQAAVVAPTGAGYVCATTATGAEKQVQTAIRRAILERRPIVLDIANDIQREEWANPVDTASLLTMLESMHGQRLRPDPDAIAVAARLLDQARRPVVLAGRGAVWAQAGKEIEALAERTGALLSTTLLAKSLFDDDPWSLGVAGAFGTGLATDLLGEADLVLAVGASLHSWTTSMGTVFPNATVVQIDSDAAAIGDFTAVDQVVLGDAREAVTALAEACAQREAGAGFRTAAVREAIDSYDPRAGIVDTSPERRVDPRLALIELNEVLPAQRMVLSDGGHYWSYPSLYLDVPEPSSFVLAANFGSLGLGIGTAVGAATARPDRTAVLVVGDGGLLMSLPELETAARYALPMVVIVVNDSAYGSEVHSLRGQGFPVDTAQFPETDFARLAEGVGARGVTVRSLADIAQVADAVGSLDRPLVIDLKIDPDLVADWFRKAKPPTPTKTQ